jgi:hypothetical protein
VPQDLGPKPIAYPGKWVKKPRRGNFIRSKKKREAIEGPIKIPVDSSLFLFNVLALLSISSKSLKLQLVLFSKAHGPYSRFQLGIRLPREQVLRQAVREYVVLQI